MVDSGFGALIDEPPPYSADAEQALDCWRFCGGWNPERLPLYLATQRVDDLGCLIDMLQAIRGEVDRKR